MQLYRAFIAVCIISALLFSSASAQEEKPVPPEIVRSIPLPLVYEGSVVSIIWESQKKDIELLYKNGKWRINRGRLHTNNIKGKVSIVGIADKDTALESNMILHGNELVFTTEIK